MIVNFSTRERLLRAEGTSVTELSSGSGFGAIIFPEFYASPSARGVESAKL